MIDWLRKLFSTERQGRLCPESQFVVSINEEMVGCVHPDGHEEALRWDDLRVVAIETNDSGPLACDVWWVLVSLQGDSGCVIPQGATGEDQLLSRLQELPGFDDEALIAAMSSAENERFVCWKARSH